MKKAVGLLAVLGVATRLSADPCPSIQWTLQHQYASPEVTRSVLPIDYDEDGTLDLISVEGDNSGLSLFSRRGVGDGTFEAPATIETGVNPSPVATDLNGDDHADLIVAANGGFKVFPGTGSGFGAPVSYTPDVWIGRVALAGHFDSDGGVELVALSSLDRTFIVYDAIDGAFIEVQRGMTSELPMSVAIADFDNDGLYDVLVGERIAQTMSVFFRNADGTFAAPVSFPAGDYPSDVAVGDVNGDGLRDFAVSHWTDGNVRVYRNAGSRQFTQTTLDLEPPDGIGTVANELLLHDLNADGHLDIVAPATNGSGGLTTFLGVGDGTFRTPTWSQPSPFASNGVLSAAVADVNKDGVLDLIAATYDSQLIFSASCATQPYVYAKSGVVTVGQDAILEVSISGFSATPPADRGTVSSGGASAPVDAGGHATLHVSDLPLGEQQLTVTFSGNNDVPAGTSAPVTVEVSTETSTTTLSTPDSQPVYGTPWPAVVDIEVWNGAQMSTFTLIVDGVSTVHEIADGAVPLNLEPGPHTIQARFEGTAGHPPSESEVVSVISLQATPTITPAGALAVHLGTAHSLQFTVAGSAQTTAATGTLQMIEGSTIVATLPLVNGVAAFSGTLLRGAHDMQLFYSGDVKFTPKTTNLTLHVLGTTALAIEARGLPSAMHIAYVAPDNTTSITLYRRVAGTVSYAPVPSWNSITGIDPTPLTRGVVYEYVLIASFPGGATSNSNVDSAMLFTDDTLTSGTRIKLAHFVELRQAINEMRGAAGLASYTFPAGFGANGIVRASHFNGLRTALVEARGTLNMSPANLPSVVAGTTRIFASSVQKLRDAAR